VGLLQEADTDPDWPCQKDERRSVVDTVGANTVSEFDSTAELAGKDDIARTELFSFRPPTADC